MNASWFESFIVYCGSVFRDMECYFLVSFLRYFIIVLTKSVGVAKVPRVSTLSSRQVSHVVGPN